MCGIFGMIRSTTASNPSQATDVFAALGRLAVERGKDAAGFAVTAGSPDSKVVRASRADVNAKTVALGQVTIVKDVVAFDDLWGRDNDGNVALVDAARVAIGHTRWATQGNKAALTNASPIAVGTLVGTHNGDVETVTVRGHKNLPPRFGSTDTEWLYQALHRDRKDRRKVVANLTEVEGRAALAWIDQERPDRVYLARAALSPMSVAFDADGNLYWASNPDWFRKVEDAFAGTVGFHSHTMVREGTLLTVDIAGDQPVLDDLREFTPQCRPSDMRLAGFAVWRGFDHGDEKADRSQSNRTVAAERFKAKSVKVAAKSAQDSAATFTKRWATPGLGDPLPRFSGQSVLDRLDGTEPDWWQNGAYDPADDDDFADVHLDYDVEVEAEADNAVIMWAEEGHDPKVVARLRETSTVAQQEALMVQWGLSSLDVFTRFKEGVLEWAEEMEDDLTLGDFVASRPEPLTQVLAEFTDGLTQADVVTAV